MFTRKKALVVVILCGKSVVIASVPEALLLDFGVLKHPLSYQYFPALVQQSTSEPAAHPEGQTPFEVTEHVTVAVCMHELPLFVSPALQVYSHFVAAVHDEAKVL